MKKKYYLKPTMTVVPVKYQSPLLVGSNGSKSGDRSAGMEDYNVNNYYEE